jgi:hypothetical protein
MNASQYIIFGHPGLGDHILCNGIYRNIAQQAKKCFIATRKDNLFQIQEMLSDLSNVKILNYGNSVLFHSWTTRHVNYLNHKDFKGIKTILLGDFGANFLAGERFDQSFYRQAKIDFQKRWESFFAPRNRVKEIKLFNKLVTSSKPILFLHEDKSRGFKINLEIIENRDSFQIIRPLLSEKFTIFDYRLIIERATQVHCIESSFAALIESMRIQGEKFAHRYARPEAKGDWRLEFTYKSDWKILL